jgi:oligopeptidase B
VRYREEGQHPLLCREPPNSVQSVDLKREEQVLLDGDELARGRAFFHLGATRHSSNHQLLAWLADEAGSEFYTARVRVIDTGVDLADIVPDAFGVVVWTHDVSAFFYVRLDKNHKPAGVFRHTLGTPVAEDVCVFMEADPGFFISISPHLSGQFCDISAHDHETSEAWLIDLFAADAKPTLIAARQSGIQYDVEHDPAFEGCRALLIRTNADDAEDFKIVWTPLTTPGRAYWRDLVPCPVLKIDHRKTTATLTCGRGAAHAASARREGGTANNLMVKERRGGLARGPVAPVENLWTNSPRPTNTHKSVHP